MYENSIGWTIRAFVIHILRQNLCTCAWMPDERRAHAEFFLYVLFNMSLSFVGYVWYVLCLVEVWTYPYAMQGLRQSVQWSHRCVFGRVAHEHAVARTSAHRTKYHFSGFLELAFYLRQGWCSCWFHIVMSSYPTEASGSSRSNNFPFVLGPSKRLRNFLLNTETPLLQAFVAPAKPRPWCPLTKRTHLIRRIELMTVISASIFRILFSSMF